MNLTSRFKMRLRGPHGFHWEGGVGPEASVQHLRLVSGSISTREGRRSFISDGGLHPASHSLPQSCGSLLRWQQLSEHKRAPSWRPLHHMLSHHAWEFGEKECQPSVGEPSINSRGTVPTCGLFWAISPRWWEVEGPNPAYSGLYKPRPGDGCVCPEEGIALLQSACPGSTFPAFREVLCVSVRSFVFIAVLAFI